MRPPDAGFNGYVITVAVDDLVGNTIRQLAHVAPVPRPDERGVPSEVLLLTILPRQLQLDAFAVDESGVDQLAGVS